MSETKLVLELNSKVSTVTPECDISRLYQQEAVEQILNVFKQHARTHIVMACGTGKTRVALWVAEQLGAKNIVIFVPSLALVSQLMKEWLKVTIWPSVSCLAVCSDETVTYGIDSVIVDSKECNFPVTTDPTKIHQFLKNTTNDVRIVFCTYHSSAMLSEGMQGCEPFSYGVFDEAHRTTGLSYFGLGVDNQAIPIQKRLFMTATPKHYNINKKNQAGEPKLVYSMDSEALYGPRAYTLSFRNAINLGIITDYKIMISVVSEQQALTEESELDNQIVALRKAVLKDSNIVKVITFHQTIDEARSFSFHIQGKHDALPGFTSLHVNSLMPSHSRHDIMHTFQKNGKSIISNARCLTEGIDVPAVDMVAFLNAKKSKIDIVQAIGRAMRKAPGKAYGYVFLPLFVEKNAGESIEDAILRADYEDIWGVVQAFSEQDEDLHATIENLKQQKGKTGTLVPGLERYLEIISYDDVNVSLQEKLKQVVSIAIIDKIASNWHEMYGKLALFRSRHHHANVPIGYKDKPLASWVSYQRIKKNILSQEKIKLLDAIGFEWDPNEVRWNRCYEELKAFKVAHPQAYLHQIYEKNRPLRQWAFKQRSYYQHNKLSGNRIKLLDSIGFEWNPLDANWNFNYDALCAFKSQHLHCNVPSRYQQNKTLGIWVGKQRQCYKNNRLSTHKIKLLDAIGFEWNPYDVNWHFNYDALCVFKSQHRHCNVPSRYQQNKTLENWVGTQRQHYKRNKLSENKIKLLEAIGFEWDIMEANWRFRYEELKIFQATNSHCNVPQGCQKNSCLGQWVTRQRRSYKNNSLSADKVKLLEAIGFEWDSSLGASWHLTYMALKEFKKQNNHSNVPLEYQQNKVLGNWVKRQRENYKNNRLSDNKINLLNSIGFVWKRK